eukprot:2491146-Amphidinium_carterae.1
MCNPQPPVEILRVPHSTQRNLWVVVTVVCALHAANTQPPHLSTRFSAAKLSRGDRGAGGCSVSSSNRKP